MNEDQIKQLTELAYKTKETVDRLETNWELDRKDFSEFQNRLGHLEVEFKQLRDQILLLPKRTSEKVSDAVDEIKQEAHDLKQAMNSKKVTVLQPNPKKHWWQFKKGGSKNGN